MLVMCPGMTNSFMFSHRRATRPPVQGRQNHQNNDDARTNEATEVKGRSSPESCRTELLPRNNKKAQDG